jgi:hypothetical protein
MSNIKNESPDCILSKKECALQDAQLDIKLWIHHPLIRRYSAKQLTKGIGRFFKSKNEGTLMIGFAGLWYVVVHCSFMAIWHEGLNTPARVGIELLPSQAYFSKESLIQL